MSFLALLATFAPWLTFKIIILLPLCSKVIMVKIGVTVAAVICAYQAWTGLHKGFILWGGLLFFGFSLLTTVLMTNVWVMQHLSILSHGVLAAFTWLSILVGKPFTEAYAQKNAAKEVWNSPLFKRTNYIITAVWGLSFSFNVISAYIHIAGYLHFSPLVFEIAEDSSMLLAMIFTNYYVKYCQNKRNRLSASPAK